MHAYKLVVVIINPFSTDAIMVYNALYPSVLMGASHSISWVSKMQTWPLIKLPPASLCCLSRNYKC